MTSPLTAAMRHYFPVRKCSVSRRAGRASIRDAVHAGKIQQIKGGANTLRNLP